MNVQEAPVIVYKLTHIVQLVTWTFSRLSWDLSLQGRDQSLNIFIPSTDFIRMNNQEGPTTFNTPMWSTLWDSGFTHSINPYFELHTEHKPLYPGDGTSVNSIGRVIKHQMTGTIILDLEDNTIVD